MIKIFKNLEKKDFIIIFFVMILVIFSVFLELKIPEYMSEITKLVQTESSTMKEILLTGSHMIICAVSSLACTIIIGYLTSVLAARFSRSIRRKLFAKVED